MLIYADLMVTTDSRNLETAKELYAQFSNQLSISPERPLDPLTLETLKLLDGFLRREAIPYTAPTWKRVR